MSELKDLDVDLIQRSIDLLNGAFGEDISVNVDIDDSIAWTETKDKFKFIYEGGEAIFYYTDRSEYKDHILYRSKFGNIVVASKHNKLSNRDFREKVKSWEEEN